MPGHRWFVSAVILGYLAFQLFYDGFSLEALVGFLVIVLFWFFGDAMIRRVRVPRPWRSYLIAGLVSAALGLLFFRMSLDPIVVYFWLAISAGGLFWAWYWERTEPLPPTP